MSNTTTTTTPLTGLNLRHVVAAGVAAKANDCISAAGYTAVAYTSSLVALYRGEGESIGDAVAEIRVAFTDEGGVTLEAGGGDAEWAARIIGAITF